MGGRGLDPVIRGQNEERVEVLLDGMRVEGACPSRMDPPTSRLSTALAPVLEEAGNADMFTGWLAFALFAPLAITSNDASMRALKRGWKRLHRLVYPAAILVFAHWALAAFDPTTAWIHTGILAAIEIVRIALQRAQRVT